MKLSKKATIEPFPFILAVMGIVILLAVVGVLLSHYDELKKTNPDPLGSRATNVLNAYQKQTTHSPSWTKQQQ